MIQLIDVTTTVNQLLPEPHAGLLNGILFGTKAMLNPELKDALIRSGTLHIAALSGMNITILMNLTASTLLRVFSRKITSVLTVVIIIGFVLFVGISPSVVRAAAMGCMTLISTVFGRQRGALYSLVFTSLIMIIARPDWLNEISFQLSFLATLGLILFGNVTSYTPENHVPELRSFKHKCWRFVLDDLHTTLAAQVFTLPIFFFTFHRLSIISPVANLLIGFLIPPLTVLGLVCSLLGVFSLQLATPLSWIIWCLLEYILLVIFRLSSLPFASIEW